MSALSAGAAAPDFKLSSHDGQEITLSQQRGHNVLLAFFPLAFTPVCSCQLPAYGADLARFEAQDCRVLAIGVGHPASHKAWVDSMGGVGVPVLSDFYPHGEVARKYGVLREEGFPERALFLIDRDGVVRYSAVGELGRQPDNQVILRELKKLS